MDRIHWGKSGKVMRHCLGTRRDSFYILGILDEQVRKSELAAELTQTNYTGLGL